MGGQAHHFGIDAVRIAQQALAPTRNGRRQAYIAAQDEDRRMVVAEKGHLGAVVAKFHAEQGRILLEMADQVEAESPRCQFIVERGDGRE